MNPRFLFGLLAGSVFATVLAAQTPPCIAQNDGNNNSSGNLTAFSFAGANGRGWQFTAPQSTTLLAAELFTGNSFLTNKGYMTLEVWDTNFIFQPGQRLGGGTFESDGALGHEWHGANFDQPVSVTAGQTYWLVWWEPGFSEMPPESKVTPLPTSATGASEVLPPRYSITISLGACSEPRVTDRKESIFSRLRSASSRILVRTCLWSRASWRAREAR